MFINIDFVFCFEEKQEGLEFGSKLLFEALRILGEKLHMMYEQVFPIPRIESWKQKNALRKSIMRKSDKGRFLLRVQDTLVAALVLSINFSINLPPNKPLNILHGLVNYINQLIPPAS